MGYCIQKEEGSIKIKRENMMFVMSELSNFFENGGKLKWVNGFNMIELDTLEEMWDDLRYECIYTDNHYEISDFLGEKLGDDLLLFQIISKYCEDGFLQFVGEDGEHFRIIISNGQAYEKWANLCWD